MNGNSFKETERLEISLPFMSSEQGADHLQTRKSSHQEVDTVELWSCPCGSIICKHQAFISKAVLCMAFCYSSQN